MKRKEKMPLENFTSKCPCGEKAYYVFTIRNFQFFDCNNCTLRFVSPRYLASEIYDETYFIGASHGFGFTNYEEDKIASAGYLLKFIKKLKSFDNRPNLKLLDVGAANGYFVNLASQHGYAASGIEISSEAVKWARKLNRNVVQGTLETFLTNQKYSIVTALDVLEHIPEPLEFLNSCKTILEEEGLLLINVPFLGSFTAQLAGKKWHAYLPPEHWIYFNKKSISQILELAGFKIIYMKAISKSFTLGYIYTTVINSPQIPSFVKNALRTMNIFFKIQNSKFKIYLPLFDNLCVVASSISK